ncbi:MAG: TetR/AcrR family transcriptional regulator, partial [Oscillospiraceae bacterium]|nr:TetR/AcrR family transcriptional regulator [Oscillospiraceae bacterium]
MDKRFEENKRVKNEIARAFFALLRQKQADDISVTEITAKAKVSRMAYYRNFQSKMDVIDFYLQETVWDELSHKLQHNPQFHTLEYGIAFFK